MAIQLDEPTHGVDPHHRLRRIVHAVVLGASIILNWLLIFGLRFPGSEMPLSWRAISVDSRLMGAAGLVMLTALAAYWFYLQKRKAEILLRFDRAHAESLGIEAELRKTSWPGQSGDRTGTDVTPSR
jgi:hypothetical protein